MAENEGRQTIGSDALQDSALPSTTYAAAFRCIGAECEDHCCGGWEIPLDRTTYGRYLQFPVDALGPVVTEFVVLNPSSNNERHFASIQQADSGLCPFFQDDHLCAIQQRYGPQLLSATCSIFPRSLSRVAGRLEGTLSLSCPEAARNVLLNPNFMAIEGDLFAGSFRTDNVFCLTTDEAVEALFAPIRQMLIAVVTDRSVRIWHRLLRIGFLCRRLEEIAADDGEGSLPRIRAAYERIVEDEVVQREFEAMPGDPRLLLEVTFALTNARLAGPHGRRFRETFWSFVEGIGQPDVSTSSNDIERLLDAEQRYCRPFFQQHPFIQENYLLNYMLRELFPYGRSGSADFRQIGIFDEYIRMAAQFAWLNALLIGVAAQRREAFSGEDVVRTIQSFSRAIEHNSEFLGKINEYLDLKGLNSVEGMAKLLKVNR